MYTLPTHAQISIYIHVLVYVRASARRFSVCQCLPLYIYIYRERERETDRQRQRPRQTERIYKEIKKQEERLKTTDWKEDIYKRWPESNAYLSPRKIQLNKVVQQLYIYIYIYSVKNKILLRFFFFCFCKRLYVIKHFCLIKSSSFKYF